MSGDARSQKKKDKRKRKANIEQLQQEEYKEERTRIPVPVDEDDDVLFRPARAKRQEDEIDLLESNEKSGSGLCVKLVFLLLIGSVGLAIGVVFLEIDASRDISSLVATSTAKVSAVLEETSASVSSLWEEHGSSVSSLFESVKQSIGMEGEAPLENLADKKDVESPVSEPVEKLEEFFDEGEEIVDYPVEADFYSAPIEKADGDVAPEPVQPADSYEEPEVSYELEQPVLAEAEELDQEAESSEDQVESTEQLTESVEDQIIPDEAQVTLTQEVPEPTSAEQLDDEPVVADSAEADSEEDALSVEEETEDVSVEQDQVAEPEAVVTRDDVVEEEAVPVAQKAEASQEEADSVEREPEPEVAVTLDEVVQEEAVPADQEAEASQEEADSVEQEAEPEIVVTRDEVVLEEAVLADQEAEASQEEDDSVAQVAEPEVVVSRDEAVQEEAVPFDQESEPSLSQEVGSEETEDFVPDTPLDEGSEEVQFSRLFREDVVETQTFDEEVPEIVEAVPQIVVSSPASSPEEVPVVAIVNDAENEILQSEEVEEDSQEALKVESVPQSDVIVEEPISVKEEQAEQQFAGSYGAPPTPEVPVVAVVNDAENEIFQSEEVEEDSQEALKAAYSKIDVTNDDDWEIREELDDAESAISKSGLEALAMFEDILRDHPDSPRALYGRALALHKLSEKERSNSRLEQAIFAYRNVIDLERAVPDALYRLAGNHCVDRMKFRGFQGKAIRTQQRLILRFPSDLSLQNELVVIYLTVGQNDAAKELLLEILKTWPDSGFAKVHYGFILKNVDNNMEEGAKYMKEGIDSGEAGTSDGRFFYHLGDALERLGRREDAKKVYEDGAKFGLFRSKDQRSLYNVDRLQSKPFWTQEETTYQDFFRKLESNWEVIRDEGVSLMNLTPPEGFKNEAESLRDTGDWKQFELFARGRKLPGCTKAPKTCALLETFSPASTCKRGQAKFSVMHPGTHVWPHTGPTNCRLRSHLGLKVPDNVFLRVADETKKWEEGKLFIFDDSFDHEVWHNGTSFRLVLIVDVWHPDLTENERQTLTAI